MTNEQVAREFELRKLELQTRNSTENAPPTNKNNLLKVMTKIELPCDISIYLNLFERQIKRKSLDKEERASHVFGLLPLEIAQFISRESYPNPWTMIM